MSRKIPWTLLAVLLLALPALSSSAADTYAFTRWDLTATITPWTDGWEGVAAYRYYTPFWDDYGIHVAYKGCSFEEYLPGEAQDYSGSPQHGIGFTGSVHPTCTGALHAETLYFDLWLEPLELYHFSGQSHLAINRLQEPRPVLSYWEKGWRAAATGRATICFDASCETLMLDSGSYLVTTEMNRQ